MKRSQKGIIIHLKGDQMEDNESLLCKEMKSTYLKQKLTKYFD